MTDSTFDPRALAAKLAGLRHAGKQASTAEFPLPGDHRQAMDAQNFLSAEEAIRSNAWKVSMPMDNQPVTAPLHPYFEAVSGAKLPWVAGQREFRGGSLLARVAKACKLGREGARIEGRICHCYPPPDVCAQTSRSG